MCDIQLSRFQTNLNASPAGHCSLSHLDMQKWAHLGMPFLVQTDPRIGRGDRGPYDQVLEHVHGLAAQLGRHRLTGG